MRLATLTKIVATLALLLLWQANGYTQSSFSDFEAADKKLSAEVEQFLGVLNGEDNGRALRALAFMLESDNPELIRAAKDFGLYSPSVDVRSQTLAAIFDQGGPFRIELDLVARPDDETGMTEYLHSLGGSVSVDEKLGRYVFSLDKYNPEQNCWPFKGNKNCAITLVGETVSLAGWKYGAGSLTLDDDAKLVGALEYSYRKKKPVPATIQLIE